MKLVVRWARMAHVALAMAASASAIAVPIQPQSLLVSNLNSGVLTEYTRTGAVVQSFSTPDFGGGFHDLRDITQGADGRVHMFNGTFTPALTTLNPSTGLSTSLTAPGWSTVNNISYGGIGVYGNSVFVTDMFTYSGGESAGIVRFDLTTGLSDRFGSAYGYTDLTVGLDGLLYAYSSQIDVYDPLTAQLVRSFSLESQGDVRGIAVDRTGTIFAADWNGGVTRYDSFGSRVGASLSLGASLTDIDINADGDIVIGSRFGQVFLTDANLAGWNSFSVGGGFGPTVHVAFANSVTAVPEPSTFMLLIAGCVVLAVRRAVK